MSSVHAGGPVRCIREFAELLSICAVCTRVPVCMLVSTQTTHVKLNNVHVKLSNLALTASDTNRPQTISLQSSFGLQY